jgi:hypothetical protein
MGSAFCRPPSWRVRFHVAAALPSLVDPECIEADALAVLQRLCRDDDAETRFYAPYALLEEVIEVEAEQLNRSITDRLDDPDEQIREFARAAWNPPLMGRATPLRLGSAGARSSTLRLEKERWPPRAP